MVLGLQDPPTPTSDPRCCSRSAFLIQQGGEWRWCILEARNRPLRWLGLHAASPVLTLPSVSFPVYTRALPTPIPLCTADLSQVGEALFHQPPALSFQPPESSPPLATPPSPPEPPGGSHLGWWLSLSSLQMDSPLCLGTNCIAGYPVSSGCGQWEVLAGAQQVEEGLEEGVRCSLPHSLLSYATCSHSAPVPRGQLLHTALTFWILITAPSSPLRLGSPPSLQPAQMLHLSLQAPLTPPLHTAPWRPDGPPPPSKHTVSTRT